MGKECQEYVPPPPSLLKEQEEDTMVLVKSLLEEGLGSQAWLVIRFLDWPGPLRSCIQQKASLRWERIT